MICDWRGVGAGAGAVVGPGCCGSARAIGKRGMRLAAMVVGYDAWFSRPGLCWTEVGCAVVDASVESAGDSVAWFGSGVVTSEGSGPS